MQGRAFSGEGVRTGVLMAAVLYPELQTKNFGLRFLVPEIENAYRELRLDLTALLIKWVHVIGWLIHLLIPTVSYFVNREIYSLISPYWASIFVPSYTVAVGISFTKFWKRLALPTLVALQVIGGCGGIWALGQIGASTGTVILWAIFLPMFVPFMRIPPLIAILAVTPSLSMGMFTAMSAGIEGTVGIAENLFLIITPLSVFTFILIMCVMIDYITRQTFIKNQIIAHQKDSLERSQSVIRRYIPPRVADKIIDGEESSIEKPERLRVTILFADICGFTEIADRVEPEVMTEILNDYMSRMAELIESHDGTLNEFAGDGLMAVFGAPDPLPPEEQAKKAVKAAQAMQTSMSELNDQWQKLGIGTELRTRIGINTGMNSVGSYGSLGRRTYTAIGLQTNIASRIESAAEPGQILISEATYQLASDQINCEPKGEVDCKGVHFPVKVYAPRGPHA